MFAHFSRSQAKSQCNHLVPSLGVSATIYSFTPADHRAASFYGLPDNLIHKMVWYG